MDVTTMIPTRKKETCWAQNSTCSEEELVSHECSSMLLLSHVRAGVTVLTAINSHKHTGPITLVTSITPGFC